MPTSSFPWLPATIALMLCSPARATEGRAIIRSFGPQETGITGEVWVTAQDERGLLYFGADAVLTFDGERWAQHEIPGSYDVRALAVTPTRLWVGAINEIGYFERTADGDLSTYRSLLAHLPEGERTLYDVWHVFPTQDGAIFVTIDSIIAWNGRSMRVHRLPGARRLPAMQSSGRVYISHSGTGLWSVEEDRLRPVDFDDILENASTLWLEEGPDGWLLATSRGLFTIANGEITPFAPEASEFIASNVLSAACRLPNGDLCLGTINGGIAVVSVDGRLKRVLTSGDGLPASLILSLFVDRDGALWMTSTIGLARIALEHGGTLFDAHNGLAGKPARSIAESDTDVLVATDEGVFGVSRTGDGSRAFRRLPALSARYRDILGAQEGLYAGGYKTVDRLANGRLSQVFSTERDVLMIRRAQGAPGAYLLADDNELVRIVSQPDGELTRSRTLRLPDGPREAAEDAAGHIWVATQSRGVFKVAPDPAAQPIGFDVDGEQPHGRSLVGPLADGVVICVGGKVFFHQTSSDRLVPIPEAPRTEPLAISNPDAAQRTWVGFASPFTNGERAPVIVRLSIGSDRRTQCEFFKVPGLPTIGGLMRLFVDHAGILWAGGTDGLLRLDPGVLRPVTEPHAPLLRATFPDGATIAHDRNSIGFDFAALEFGRRETVRFQTKLARDAEWSGPDDTSHLTLAGLRDGAYEFAVRTINDAGLVSAASHWAFTVLPPWYRTKSAFAAWTALALLGFVGVVQWRSAYLRRRNQLLEDLVRRKTEQLEKANAAKSEFLANMSHEIRNPITGILGLSLAMEETPLDPRQKYLTDSIHSCATLLTTLVDDVLDFSKIEAGRIDLRPAPFELRAALDQCAAMVAEEIRKTGGHVAIEISPDVPARVIGDVARVQQIVLNYLSNAVKFGEGKPIAVTAVLREAGRIRLSVSDSGAGMTEAEVATLFTKFTRLPQAHASNIRGSGLGLAVCRLLATKMGGMVGVDSRRGEGSTFWADLPLPAAHAPAAADDDVPAAPPTPLRALIVEDIDYNAIAMQAVLRKLGISSEVAADGLVALEKLQQAFYDVVFMDWNLPGMIGTEVVVRYRAIEPADRRTIIIATTAYSADFNREACLQAGMDAFIAKPFTPEKIGAALADLRGSLRAAASLSVPRRSEPATAQEFDLQMLRFLADESPAGLRGEIGRYVASFNTDREAARSIVASGSPQEIHRIAHRLVGHASAIKYEPLMRLARELQAQAALDDRALLRGLLAAFDREFAELRKKLDSSRS